MDDLPTIIEGGLHKGTNTAVSAAVARKLRLAHKNQTQKAKENFHEADFESARDRRGSHGQCSPSTKY
jgi:hypothetical protein